MDAGSTADGLAESRQPLAAWLRRAALLILAALVGLGLAGLLGVRTGERVDTGEDYRLSVRYPEVARAGLDTTWQVTVTRSRGLPDRLQLAVTGSYFELFEAQAFHPEPSGSTRDGSTLYLTFDTTPGATTFVVDFDAYVQPASQRGRAARIAVVEDGAWVAAVDYQTHLLP